MPTLYTPQDEERPLALPHRPGLESESYRSAWRRDYARLIHSAAFRRLQGKTQLFPGLESDFFRNRLTHSLEVAQIAKSIAIRLNNTHPFFIKHPLEPDLVETAGLAHDLGHPPFGHNGEAALNECMKIYGGFEGNAQTLRILARLEKRAMQGLRDNLPVGIDQTGRDFRFGLNLTYRTLASVLKYDKKIPRRRRQTRLIKGYYESEARLVEEVKKHVLRGRKAKTKFKTIECGIMDIADDIAYTKVIVQERRQSEIYIGKHPRRSERRQTECCLHSASASERSAPLMSSFSA